MNHSEIIDKDEVLKMARQAGASKLVTKGSIELGLTSTDKIIAFAKLVAAKEREACAKVCDEYAIKHGLKGDDNSKAQGWMMMQCAAEIRLKGKS